MTDVDEDVSPEDTGARLRAVRELAGMSVGEVARSTGLSRRHIALVERGRRTLEPDELRAVAGALGVEAAVLVSGTLPVDTGDDFVGNRIDEVVGHDPDHWHALPASAADLPPALPFDLPESERRTDLGTRQKVDESWAAVRREMDELTDACARLVVAGSGDDVQALIHKVQTSIERLDRKRSFQRYLARHNTELGRVRGIAAAGATSFAEVDGDAR